MLLIPLWSFWEPAGERAYLQHETFRLATSMMTQESESPHCLCKRLITNASVLHCYFTKLSKAAGHVSETSVPPTLLSIWQMHALVMAESVVYNHPSLAWGILVVISTRFCRYA